MSHRNDHERSDMDPRYILFFGVGLAILCAIVIAGVWGLYGRFERQDEARGRPAPVGEITPVPEPRLQVNPQGDLEKIQAQETEILSTYAWIDRDDGVARIPIDRAMQLLVERQKK
jgi:hypothetical protein